MLKFASPSVTLVVPLLVHRARRSNTSFAAIVSMPDIVAEKLVVVEPWTVTTCSVSSVPFLKMPYSYVSLLLPTVVERAHSVSQATVEPEYCRSPGSGVPTTKPLYCPATQPSVSRSYQVFWTVSVVAPVLPDSVVSP